MSDRLDFFAPCPKGVEAMLADELRRLGVSGVRPQRSGVLFSGRVEDAQRVVFWSRLASRVLLTLGSVSAQSADAIYAAVKDLPWEQHVRASGTIAVDASGTNDALRNTQFTAVRVKDAIADRFREAVGERPSVDTRNPDLRINVALRGERATVSIDLAGDPLHRRGYREPGVQVEAPLKEHLAAAVLEWSGWRNIAERGGAFVDPMCGSGTMAIEAALVAADIAPGLLRGTHAIERWSGFDPEPWERMRRNAEKRRAAGLDKLPVIVASDSDPRAIDIARECVKRAGLEFYVHVELADVTELSPPDDVEPGLIATNPPWGQRLGERGALRSLYATLAERIKGGFDGWDLAVVSPDPDLARGLGLLPVATATFGSGKGEISASEFTVRKASQTRPTQDAARPEGDEPAAPSEFSNRLSKMAKHLGKWARRTGVTCYRVYDADLPSHPFAIDVYEGAGPDTGARWVHVAEYAPPAEIPAQRAEERVAESVPVVSDVLGVAQDAVFVKRRERQRGSFQYGRVEARGTTGIVAEDGLRFEVNLSDYLDTGLFLDHRDTRALIREWSAGKSFLNLFAYTGTASVYAAAGGAISTCTVDLSATYTDWAARNMALNGFVQPVHEFVREDVLAWVREAIRTEDRYDLIFCDPPTFSASKRMVATFDVQRDHVDLLTRTARLLAPGGTLLFSCNRKGFVMDEAGLSASRLVVRDVTARTIPKDFERTPGVHGCWTIRRA